METMKFYTEEEILDKHIGKKGTPKRDQFEADLNSFLIGEAIKQARQSKNLTQEELGNLIGVQRAQISRMLYRREHSRRSAGVSAVYASACV